jgi:hypothetical protein
MRRGTHSPRFMVSPGKQRSPGALGRRDGSVNSPGTVGEPGHRWGCRNLDRVGGLTLVSTRPYRECGAKLSSPPHIRRSGGYESGCQTAPVTGSGRKPQATRTSWKLDPAMFTE